MTWHTQALRERFQKAAPQNSMSPPAFVVGGGVGAAGDTSVPDPLHPECTITFHCDIHGQHCTSTSSCGGRMAMRR